MMFSGFRRRVLFLTLKNKLLFCSEEGKLTKVCLWFLRESQQEVKPDRLTIRWLFNQLAGSEHAQIPTWCSSFFCETAGDGAWTIIQEFIHSTTLLPAAEDVALQSSCLFFNTCWLPVCLSRCCRGSTLLVRWSQLTSWRSAGQRITALSTAPPCVASPTCGGST